MSILRAVVIASVVVATSAVLSAQTVRIGNLDVPADSALARKEHPRLLFTTADLPAIRDRIAKSGLQSIYNQLKQTVDQQMGQNMDATQMSVPLGLLYHITGDERYGQACRAVTLGASFGAYATDGLYGYDLIYNLLTPAERSACEAKMLAQARTGNANSTHLTPLTYALGLWGNGTNDAEVGGIISQMYSAMVTRKAYLERWAADRGGDGNSHDYLGQHEYVGTMGVLQAWKSSTGQDLFEGFNWAKAMGPYYIYNILPGSTRTTHIGVDGSGQAFFPWETGAEAFVSIAQNKWQDGVTGWWVRNTVCGGSQPYYYILFKYWGMVLYFDPDVPDIAPSQMPQDMLFKTRGYMYSRSDWGNDATFVNFACGRFELDSRNCNHNNSFIIYRKAYLACDTGSKIGNNEENTVNSDGQHYSKWFPQTIAHNSITVGTANNLTGLVTSMCGGQAGRVPDEWLTMYGMPVSEENRMTRQAGQITAYETSPEFSYVVGDARCSYDPHVVNGFTRQFVYIRPGAVVIFDRVNGVNANDPKRWYLHTMEQPTCTDGTLNADTSIHSSGHFLATGTTLRAAHGGSALFSKTVLPESAIVRVLGGTGHQFEVNGVNYDMYEPWYQTVGTAEYRENIGLGLWRAEVEPQVKQANDVFLHVLWSTTDSVQNMFNVTKISQNGQVGVSFTADGVGVEVTFAQTGTVAGHIKITKSGNVICDRALATQIEDNYQKWSSDSRFEDWMTDPNMKSAIGQGPVLNFLQPSGTTVVQAGSTLYVSVTARDYDGTIGNLKLFHNGQELPRQDGTYPYEWGVGSNDPLLMSVTAGVHTLTVSCTDSLGYSATTSMSIIVSGGAPAAANDAYGVMKNQTLSVAAPGVLANDSGTSLTAVKVNDTSHGSLTLNSNGSFTYTPTTGYTGSDSFTYYAHNSGGDSNLATVTITVSSAARSVLVDFGWVLTSNPGDDGRYWNNMQYFDLPETISNLIDSTNAATGISLTRVANSPTASNGNLFEPFINGYPNSAIRDNVCSTSGGSGKYKFYNLDTSGDTAYSLTLFGSYIENGVTQYNVIGYSTTSQQVSVGNNKTVFNTFNNVQPDDSGNIYVEVVLVSGSCAPLNLIQLDINHKPVATNDSYSVAASQQLNVAASGVLTNDTDSDSQTLTAIKVSDPSHGTLTFNSNGSFTYTPTFGYSGSDSFTYKASDGSTDSNTATVNITVTPASGSLRTVLVDFGCWNLTASPGADGRYWNNMRYFDVPETISNLVDSSNAATGLSLTKVANFPWACDNQLTESFINGYPNSAITDGLCSTSAGNGKYRFYNLDASGNTVYNLTIFGSCSSGDVTQYNVIGYSTTSQQVSVANNKTVFNTFNNVQPDASGYIYVEVVRVSGTNAPINLIQLDINSKPVATNDSYSIASGQPLGVAAPGVLTNDTDADGQPLTAIKVSDPAHGTLSLISNGSFTYTPTTGFSGSDSFTYKASDGFMDSNTATVNITVTASMPVAIDDVYTINANQTLNVSAAGVLANDTGSGLTAVKVMDPSHGALTLNSNGSFTYTPTTGYSGSDSFTYKAHNAGGDSNTATVNIMVTAASGSLHTILVDFGCWNLTASPGADGRYWNNMRYFDVPETISNLVDSSNAATGISLTKVVNFPWACDNMLSESFINGYPNSAITDGLCSTSAGNGKYRFYNLDASGNTVYSLTIFGSCSSGDVTQYNVIGYSTTSQQVSVAGNKTVFNTFNNVQPDASGYVYVEVVRVSGTNAPINLIQLDINHKPVAANDSYSVVSGQQLIVPISGVLTNDTDSDGQTLTAVKVTDPTHGTVTLNADGSLIYTPTTGYSGSDSFTYKANDGSSDSNTATVNITVTAAPPSARTVLVDFGIWNLTGSPGADGRYWNNMRFFDIPETISNLVDSSNAATGLSLTKVVNFPWVCDNQLSEPFINGYPNSAITDGVCSTSAGNGKYKFYNLDASGNTTYNLTIFGSCSTGDITQYNVIGYSTTSQQVSVGNNKTVFNTFNNVQPDAGGNIYVEVVLVSGGYAPLNVIQLDINHKPVATNDSYSVVSGQQLSVAASGVLTNDTDSDGQTLTAIKVTDPSHGTVTLNSNGSLTYTPTTGYSGSDSFTYKANDGSADSNTATVNITVTAAAGSLRTVLVDFGLWTLTGSPGSDGRYWNNMRYFDVPETISNLVDSTNAATGLSLTKVVNFAWACDNQLTESFINGYPNSAITDGVCSSSASSGKYKFYNLDTTGNTVYNLTIFGSCSSGGTTQYNVIGYSTTSQQVNVVNNKTVFNTFNNVQPDTDGNIYVEVAWVSGTYAPLNMIRLDINHKPVATNDSYSVASGQQLSVAAAGVLTNDTDSDGQTLTAVKVTDPTHGTVTLNSNGSFTYTPTTGYSGSDSFTYQAYDGSAYSNTATVNITVTATTRTVLVDFGWTVTVNPGADGRYWNNIQYFDLPETISDLVDSTNAATGVSLTRVVNSPWASGSQLSESFINGYPNSAISDNVCSTSAGSGKYKFYNLDASGDTTYSLTIFGSYGGGGVTQYNVIGYSTTSQQVSVGNNKTVFNTFNNVQPDASGNIYVEVVLVSGTNAPINLIQLDIVPGGGEGMQGQQMQAFGGAELAVLPAGGKVSRKPAASENKAIAPASAPAAQSGTAINVNFQPAGVTSPAGYLSDSGLVYGNRASYSFGWDKDLSGFAVERKNASSPDVRYDTSIMLLKDATWEVAVPNGMYNVKIVAGGNSATLKSQKFAVEGVPTTQAKVGQYLEETVTVVVTDGRLTINASAGSSICFIQIAGR